MKRRTSIPKSRDARLFAEPDAPPPAPAFTANIDGAARGNPGPASYGVVIRKPAAAGKPDEAGKPDGGVVAELKKYIGRATNNVAEYYALIAALDYAAAHGIHALRIESDSELLVNQMRGRYKVKSPDLRPLFERAKKLAHGLASFAIEHVPRERNRDADALANHALARPGSCQERAGDTPGGRGDGSFPARPFMPSDSARESAIHSGGRSRKRSIRARYSAGKLHPFVPLDLPDGAEVELTIDSVKRGS